MKLAILQPTFIPTLHDLAVILQADRVVLQDIEDWSRKSRVHRAKIRTPEGTQYINIPVMTKDRDKPITRVRIDHSKNGLNLYCEHWSSTIATVCTMIFMNQRSGRILNLQMIMIVYGVSIYI